MREAFCKRLVFIVDVDRAPGLDPSEYQSNCRGCHVILDTYRPAFAFLDYGVNETIYSDDVRPKLNRNSRGFGGYTVLNDYWKNPLISDQYQERFGWRGPEEGSGVLSFAQLIVDSMAFQSCMAKKVVQEFCDIRDSDFSSEVHSSIEELGQEFRQNHKYNLRGLIKSVIRSPICD